MCNINSLNIDSCNSLEINGNVEYVKTVSADVRCDTIRGDANTVSGDVVSRSIGGSVKTVSGDIST